MGKNIYKISFLAWLAILLPVFFFCSCESEGKKERERARVEEEIKIVEDSIKFYRDKAFCSSADGKILGLCPSMIDTTIKHSVFDLLSGKVNPEDAYTPEYHRLRSLISFHLSNLDSLNRVLGSLPLE
jgi:hypothetical protein